MAFWNKLVSHPQQLALGLLAAGLLATAWIYAPALDGELYLDSVKLHQLADIYEEQGTDVELGDISFGSGTGRIVSQFSFYLNIVAADGLDVRAIKLTNVAIHVLNAVLVYVLAAMVLARTSLADLRFVLAAFTALVWLISPVNLASVVYAVQRMNQLSALFSLLALIFYLHMRSGFAAGSPGVRRIIPTIAGTALLTLLAFASKENGVLVIVFIGLIELYLFPALPRVLTTRRVAVAGSVILLIAAGLASAWLLSGYWSDPAARPFTLTERLLTESRILWTYIGQLIAPSSLATGLYQDGYPISTGLLTPLTTLPALIGLTALIGFAFAFRDHETLKPVAFGMAFFLGGHLLESTVLPLELYYDHRNYLPSFGLYLALVSAGSLLFARLRFPVAATTAFAYLAFFVLMAHAKSVTWSTDTYVYDAALSRSYLSPRAASERAQGHLEDGQLEPALMLLDRIAREAPDEALRARLQILYVHCAAGFGPDDALYGGLREPTGRELPIELSQALQNILGAYSQTRCEAIDPSRLLPILAGIAAERRSAGRSAWHIDYYIAAFYLLDDGQRGADWLEARFLEGEEAAGWMLLDLLQREQGIDVAPSTHEALRVLEQE